MNGSANPVIRLRKSGAHIVKRPMDLDRLRTDLGLNFSIVGGVATVRVDLRGEEESDLSRFWQQLESIWSVLGAHPDIIGLVICGNTAEFLDGNQLTYSPGAGSGLDEVRELARQMLNCEATTVAAVSGLATGLGCSIAGLCDHRLVCPSVAIGDQHVQFGRSPDPSAVALWPFVIGRHHAKELLMGGELIDAERAVEIGFADRLVPQERLLAEASLAIIRSVTANAGSDLPAKRILREPWKSVAAALDIHVDSRGSVQ